MAAARKPLPVGTRVRVYRTSQPSPHWFTDPETGNAADPPAFSMKPWVWGTVRLQHDIDGAPVENYSVTVIHQGRELCLNWMNRHWLRRWWEKAPKYSPGWKPRDVKPKAVSRPDTGGNNSATSS